MSHRDKNPEPAIIEAVIRQKGSGWSQSTQDTARSDAQRILEALVAEVGVERAVQALDHQGIAGYAYRYLLKPLYAEAQRRRARAARDPSPKGRDVGAVSCRFRDLRKANAGAILSLEGARERPTPVR
jgi:hypothetical protein